MSSSPTHEYLLFHRAESRIVVKRDPFYEYVTNLVMRYY